MATTVAVEGDQGDGQITAESTDPGWARTTCDANDNLKAMKDAKRRIGTECDVREGGTSEAEEERVRALCR
jgi:YD repeat-containing protein